MKYNDKKLHINDIYWPIVVFFLTFQMIIFGVGFVLDKGLLLMGVLISLFFGIVILLQPFWGAVICISMVFAYISSYFFGGLFKFVATFTLFSLIAQHLYGMKGLKYSKQNNLIFLFLLFVVLSIFFSHNIIEGLSNFFEFVKSLMLMFLVYVLYTKEKHFLITAWAITASAAFASILGYYEYFTQSEFFVRLGSHITDPNNFALLQVAAFPFSYSLIRIEKSWFKKLLVVAAMFIIVSSLPPTLSRGGFLAFSVVLLAIFYKERKSKGTKIIFSIFSIIVLIFLIIQFSQGVDAIINRITEIDQSFLQRYRVLKGAIHMFNDHLIFGVGIGNYLENSIQYSGLTVPLYAHNMFLHVGAEMGIFAFIVFLTIFTTAFRNVTYAENYFEKLGDFKMQFLTRGIFLSLLGFTVGGLFLSQHFSKVLWTLIGLSTAVYLVAIKRSEMDNDSKVSGET